MYNKYPRLQPNGCPVARGSMICWQATKILNKESVRAPKTYNSNGSSLYTYFQ